METCGKEKEEKDGGVLVIENKNFDLIGDTEPQVVISAEGKVKINFSEINSINQADEQPTAKQVRNSEGDNPNFKSSSAPQSAK